MQLFGGSEGLEHTITSNLTCLVYVISCKYRDCLVSIHGEKLVADHQKAWGYLLEATCNTEIEQELIACSCVPDVWEVIQGWSLSTSDGSCVHVSFNSGHRRDDSNFPGRGVGQQQLWAREGIGQQQQQQHDSWNRQ